MSRIVVPLDGSARAERALGPAERLARLLNGHIELVHVVDGRAGRGPAADEGADRAARYLETVAERLSTTAPTQARIIEGSDPAAEVISFAGSAANTVIAMSTRGLGTIGRLVFGSVADNVVQRARVPVVLVRCEAPSRFGPMRRIILPLDGSHLAEQALPWAAELARRSDATISLVHVIDLPAGTAYSDFGPAPGMVFDAVERSRDNARSYLDAIASRLRSSGVRTTWEVRVGGATHEIARAAATTGADLIVMSTHGRTGLRRIALGSVTQAVVTSGAAPVMIVPAAS